MVMVAPSLEASGAPCAGCEAWAVAQRDIPEAELPRHAARLLREHLARHAPNDRSANLFCHCVSGELALIAAHVGSLAGDEDALEWMPIPMMMRILSSPCLGLNRRTAVAVLLLICRYSEALEKWALASSTPLDGPAISALLMRPLSRFCRRHWALDCACDICEGFSPRPPGRRPTPAPEALGDGHELLTPPPAPRLDPIPSADESPDREASPRAPTPPKQARARRYSVGSCPEALPGRPPARHTQRRRSLPELALPPVASRGRIYSAAVASGVFRMDMEEALTPPPASPDWGLLAGARLRSPRASDEEVDSGDEADLSDFSAGAPAWDDVTLDDDDEEEEAGPPVPCGMLPPPALGRSAPVAVPARRPSLPCGGL
eukprot:tig00001286_g8021.t1